MANTTTPTNPSGSAADFALLMATLTKLNLNAGVTLTTTTQVSSSLVIPAQSASAGAPPTPPGSIVDAASTATPSTTSTITDSTTDARPVRTTFKPVGGLGGHSAHRTSRVYTIPRPEDLPLPPQTWPPHTDYYVITSGQEVGIFFDWDDTAERVLGVPYSKYKHKSNYYHAVAIYRKAYDKSQIHVTPIAGSRFDVFIQDEWGSLDWDSDDEASFRSMTKEV